MNNSHILLCALAVLVFCFLWLPSAATDTESRVQACVDATAYSKDRCRLEVTR